METKTSIALIEKDSATRQKLDHYLRQAEGFECLGSFASGEEALLKLRDLQPDVVLMDLVLPGKNSLECLREIRRKFSHLPVLILTAYEDDHFIFSALQAGANGYILKSTPPHELLKFIRELHRGGAPMSAPVARKITHYFHEQGQKTQTLDKLSNREKEVLELLSEGLIVKEIADQLGIAFETVRDHVRKIYNKLKVHSKTEAAGVFLSQMGPRNYAASL